METRVETANFGTDGRAIGLRLRMLGPMVVERDGVSLALPASRKARALLAYLALSLHPVGRSRLCELLWDVPNDPRGELRWCLTKLRGILDDPDHPRVIRSGDMVSLRLDDCFVDAIEIARTVKTGLDALDVDQLREQAALFAGEFLESLEIDRSPQFETWLIAQRRRLKACQAVVLEQLVARLPADSDETLETADRWVELAPFDVRAHAALLGVMARRGQIGDCEAHLATAERHFQAEDLDFAPLREFWKTLKDTRKPGTLVLRQPASVSRPDDLQGNGQHPVEKPRRASLAVMPFLEPIGRLEPRGGLADGLTHDVITRLAKLRSLFVIARGSVYALAERNIGPEEAARRLDVDYVASGSVRYEAVRTVVTVELIEARTARIVWAETFVHKPDDAFLVLEEIGNMIVSSIAAEIETAERNRAVLKPPNSLDSWEAYHRGLWHMYRFTRDDNERAQHFFEMSANLDPTFARAHAGLSFTHWQSAFQHWADRDVEADRAFESAGRSLLVDEHDPSAHWAMGRALWLRGRLDESVDELERAVDLSPNFALGYYALAFVHSQSGDPQTAIGSSDHSRHLSPFDPLLFGMLSARAMAHVRLGQFEEAADWALKAAARPNAHAIILAIAAHCLALAGRVEDGKVIAATLRQTMPTYGVNDFLTTFRFTPDAEALFRQGAQRIGLG